MDASAIGAAAAVLVAVLALGVSIWELRSNRRHNRLSMRPILQMGSRNVPGESLSLIVANSGFGPAILSSYHLDLELPDGRTLHSQDPRALISRFMGLDTRLVGWGAFPGEVIAPGQEIKVVDFAESTVFGSDQRRDLVDRLGGVTFVFNYRSLYGESWRCAYRMGDGMLAPV